MFENEIVARRVYNQPSSSSEAGDLLQESGKFCEKEDDDDDGVAEERARSEC